MKKNYKVKPIKPSEIKDDIPNKVIQVFNKLIRNSWRNNKAVVYENEVKKLTKYYFAKNKMSEPFLFKYFYLDIIALYKEAGWKVQYFKPLLAGDYVAQYIFRK